MRVLHLVLHSETQACYATMAQITQPWYAQTKDVTTCYYLYDSKLAAPALEDGFLRMPNTESYIPGILDKTIAALNFPKLLLCLSKRLRSMLYGGTCIINANTIHPSHGKVEACYTPLQFAHGTCIVLRSDAVKLLLQNLQFLNRETIDDVSLGVFFKRVGMEHESMDLSGVKPFALCDPQNLGGEVLRFDATTNIDDVLVCRNHTYHTDRANDIANMKQQVNALQQRYTNFPLTIPIREIRYHTLPIADSVTVLAKHFKQWTSENNNHKLDALFGDPAPQQVKQLIVEFENDAIFSQAATLCFTVQANKLFVK